MCVCGGHGQKFKLPFLKKSSCKGGTFFSLDSEQQLVHGGDRYGDSPSGNINYNCPRVYIDQNFKWV